MPGKSIGISKHAICVVGAILFIKQGFFSITIISIFAELFNYHH